MKKNNRSLWEYIRYRFHTASIRAVIAVSFTIITVLSTVFVGLLMYGRFRTGMQTQTVEAGEKLIDQVSLNLEAYVRSMMRISDAMYYNVIKNKDLQTQNLAEEMTLLYEANKDDLTSIACFDVNGELVEAVPIANKKGGADVLTQTWYKKANTAIENLHVTTPHVQNLFEGSGTRYDWVISLARSVELTYGGETDRGILLVDMNYGGVEQLFTKVNTGNSDYVYLIDGNGEIIYHPRQQAINASLNTENNLEAATYEDGSHTETYQGRQRFVVVKTVGYTGWKIVSVIPAEDFYLSLSQMRFFVIFIVIFSILLVTLINMQLSGRIATPIQKLETSVRQLETGNLEADIYTGGSQEIRHLGKAIRSMALQMRRLMDDIVTEQEEKRKSELNALQAQINPHFLYNTLDSIVWMIEAEQYKEAISMVTALATLFRISLSKGKNIITVAEELEHARNYMNIQSVRYKNQFTYAQEIRPEILPCRTIKLILQPILENAIYHGVEAMGEEGRILLKGYVSGEDIVLEVIDNGLGMSEEAAAGLLFGPEKSPGSQRGSGVGLVNVNQRIKVYFGAAYGLSIVSEPDHGTTVRIRLPRVTGDKEETV